MVDPFTASASLVRYLLIRLNEQSGSGDSEGDSRPAETARLGDDAGLTKEETATLLVMKDPRITDADLARKLDVHRSTVGRWERVRRARPMRSG